MLDKMKKYSGWWECPNKECKKMNLPDKKICNFCWTVRDYS